MANSSNFRRRSDRSFDEVDAGRTARSNRTRFFNSLIRSNYIDYILDDVVVVVYLQEQVQQFGKARRLLRKDQYK
jgi:hypothetical protein